jgi:hypothetical protein
VEESEFLLSCYVCKLPIHACCIDPDMPRDVITYLCAGCAPANLLSCCHKCIRHGPPTASQEPAYLGQLERRLDY